MATVRLVRTAPSSHTNATRLQMSKPIAIPQRVTNRPRLNTTALPLHFMQRSGFHSKPFLRQEAKPTEKSEQQQQPQDQQAQQQEQPQEQQQSEEQLEEQALIEDLKKQLGDMKSSLTYAAADLENYKKISRRDIENATTYGITGFAKDLLEVADNLSRCLSSVPKQHLENESVKMMFEGVEMTNKGLMKAFGKHGLVKFDPTGEKFDPNKMNAIVHIPDPSKTPGSVSVTMKVGYMLKDRCIRAADVGVVAAPPAPQPQQTQQQEQPKQ